MPKVIVLGLVLVLASSVSAFAGVNVSAKACVHVEVHVSGTCTKNFPAIAACCQLLSTRMPESGSLPIKAPAFWSPARGDVVSLSPYRAYKAQVPEFFSGPAG